VLAQDVLDLGVQGLDVLDLGVLDQDGRVQGVLEATALQPRGPKGRQQQQKPSFCQLGFVSTL